MPNNAFSVLSASENRSFPPNTVEFMNSTDFTPISVTFPQIHRLSQFQVMGFTS